MPTDDHPNRNRWFQLLLAAITGAVAGAVRAGVAWILDHISA